MMDCEYRMLSFFSDINSFYNNCMMYDNLKNMLKDVCAEYYKKGYEDCKTDAIDKSNKALEQLKTGQWLYGAYIEQTDGHYYAECSECHSVRIIGNYCPNCGAKMIGSEERGVKE